MLSLFTGVFLVLVQSEVLVEDGVPEVRGLYVEVALLCRFG